MRKHVVVSTALIAIMIGGLFLGGVILGNRIRKVSAPKEQGHEQIQAPISKISPEGKKPAISVAHEGKGSDISHGRGTVSTSTSGFVIDSHQHAPEQASSLQSKGDSPKEEEIALDERKEETILDEKMFLDEKGNITDIEKWCLARMHKHGWFKPEDVPIIYEKPDEEAEGVYIWRVGSGKLEQAPIEPPEHIKIRNKEYEGELKRAVGTGDAKEVIRISQELDKLNKPYKRGGVTLTMRTCNVPPSWMPYFDVIMRAEIRKLEQERGVVMPPQF